MPEAKALPAKITRERRRLPWYIEVWGRLVREKPLGTLGGFIVLVLVITAILADVLAPYGYNEAELTERLLPYSAQHLLGTDNIGRDMLSRVIYGARVSITVGLGVVLLSTLLAVLMGLVSGYFGGLTDILLQRLVDVVMSFPVIVLVLALMALLGQGLLNVILVIALFFTFQNVRVVRGTVLQVRENQYVEAARAIGSGHLRIMFIHILPNILAPVIVLATVQLGAAILIEASLSYLGFGVPPPIPTWGGMLSGRAKDFMTQAPWMALWPGIALSAVVFGFNMLGDALRDLLDPRLKGKMVLR